MKPDTERLGQIISSINPEKADDILEKYHATDSEKTWFLSLV